jgi:hypothetical protein
VISPNAVALEFEAGFSGDDGDFIIRLVLAHGPARKVADIRISRDFLMLDKISASDRVAVGLRLGLPRLKALVDADGVDEFFTKPKEIRVVRLTTDNVPNDAAAATKFEKSCVFMVRGKTGLLCEVGRIGDDRMRIDPPNATTLPICLACGHPDDHERCDELMHVTTTANLLGPANSLQAGWHREAEGICGIGNRVLPDGVIGNMTPELEKLRISRCRVGERDCARLYWQPPAAPAFAKADGRELLREFDNLNLVINDRFGFRPVTYPHGETMARVANEARTPDEFAGAVSGLAALIGAMRWQGVEGPSIQAMETFAKNRGVALDLRAVRVLRQVARLRQAPPVHFVEADAAAAATALGITYPPDDPRAAWSRVQSITTWAIARIGDAFREVSAGANSSP